MVSNTKKEKNTKQHKHRSDHDRVEKVRERERRSPSNDDKSRSPSPTPTKSNSTDTSNSTREGTERMSLSIDETNKLRASLGLKPLTSDGNSATDPDAPKKGLNSDENYVFKPAVNLTEKKRTEQVMEKLTVQKEKRQLQGKFLATPTIASEKADSATSWVEKMRQMDEEKRKASTRAKLLQQMDDDFGVDNLMQEEASKQKNKRYASKDLSGLRIEHSIEEFKEGQQVILTLKDKKILSDKKDGDEDDDDEEEDVLINVNIADNEVAKQRADLAKKKTPGYRGYADEDDTPDQFGMFNPNKLLDQYDEKKKSSFRLESGGVYDMSDEKVMDNMKQEIRARMQSLVVPTPKVASEFYTAAEMEQFKKPKKVTKKKLRSRKMLKADDLLTMDSNEPEESSASISLRPAETRRSTAIASATKERPSTISLDKIKREMITTTENEDMLDADDDLSSFAVNDDAFDELQAVVNKTMKLKTKKDSISTEKALSELIEERDRKLKVEIKSEPMETGIILPPGPIPPDDKNLVLDTMSEFCRNVGENAIDPTTNLLTLRASKKRKQTNVASTKKSTSKTNVALDSDDELIQHALENEGLDDDAMDDTPAEDINTKPFRLEDAILSTEATLDRGLGSALRLAMQKGYIEQEKNRQNARFVSDISAKNYTVEEKNSYEIDDKHARRDRYTSGPLTDFKEKDHYHPEVNLEYVDDNGRRINEKEAFRLLSHRFHGKGSGKKKTEKRAKKQVEEEMMKKMSSVDTPLNTCNLLKQKQIQLQQPYVVLSANVMSHSVILPPVHDTSPPPFDDDVEENDIIPTIENNAILSSTPSDVLNDSNEDWKSVDDNNDTDIAQIQDDLATVDSENISTNITSTNEESIQDEHHDIGIDKDENNSSNINLTNEEPIQEEYNNNHDDTTIVKSENTSTNEEHNNNHDDIAIVDGENISTNLDLTNEESIQDEHYNNNNDDIAIVKSENISANINLTNEEPVQEEHNNDNNDDIATFKSESISTNINFTNDEPMQEEHNDNHDDWANFASFENTTDVVSESLPTPTSAVVEASTENDWANFESSPVSPSEEVLQSPINEQIPTTTTIENEDEDDDFGEFTEVQAAPTPSLQTNTISPEQIESLISTCFPMESATSSTDEDSFIPVELPSFTTYKHPSKQLSHLESSLSLWNVLSNLSNDPIGVRFQWRKSNTERFFHQALGVNERFRAKNVPLTPEVLQPIKANTSNNNESENVNNENKLSTESIRPHFDWKQSGLQNPLTVFDANKTLDLDFYVPAAKSSNEEEHTSSSSGSIQRNESPIVRHSAPIKTIDLFPGSTTTLTDDAKRIIDTLPNLSFMSAKALMFPIRFNANNNDELY
ncbi:unnamed protein product [Adineta steineri]|uniref:U4/U6.U5 tri-snRNP-associated protein 1 n=2 Tax=Adineta steineri TaxID=433720 RepID=A0A813XJJ1_9BILA|nr:unnamed protein product [Adineta steineri]